MEATCTHIDSYLIVIRHKLVPADQHVRPTRRRERDHAMPGRGTRSPT